MLRVILLALILLIPALGAYYGYLEYEKQRLMNCVWNAALGSGTEPEKAKRGAEELAQTIERNGASPLRAYKLAAGLYGCSAISN